MKLLKKLKKNITLVTARVFHGIKSNLAELYTMLVLFVAIPVVVAHLTSVMWGFLLSFAIQAVIGLLFINAQSNKRTK